MKMASYSSMPLACLLMAALTSIAAARQFVVGGGAGWAPPPSGSVSYNDWAGKNRFLIGDTLVFKYNPSVDSVARVSAEDYNSCSAANPIASYKDGNTVFQFSSHGPFYFISGNSTNCNKGEKLVIVVLYPRNNTRHFTPNAPTPAPTTSAATPTPAPVTASATPSPAPTTAATPSPAPTNAATPTPAPATVVATPTPAPATVATPTPAPATVATPTPAPTTAATPTPAPATAATPTPAPITALTPTQAPATLNSPAVAPSFSPAGAPGNLEPLNVSPTPAPVTSATPVGAGSVLGVSWSAYMAVTLVTVGLSGFFSFGN